MKIDFETVAENTFKIHGALAAKVVDETTNPLILADLAEAADKAARRLLIFEKGNKALQDEAGA